MNRSAHATGAVLDDLVGAEDPARLAGELVLDLPRAARGLRVGVALTVDREPSDEGVLDHPEATEARFYDVLAERLGTATWVTVTNRAHPAERHTRRWVLEPTRDGPAVLRVG